MNIQYHHSRVEKQQPHYSPMTGEMLIPRTEPRGGTTIAIESLKPWFHKTLVLGEKITKQIGKARCSEQDNYNKKTGRELAKSRMTKVVLTVVNIDGEHITLEDENKSRYEFKGSYFVGYHE